MMSGNDEILEALKAVKYPGFSRDIISFGLVKDVSVAGKTVDVGMKITTSDDAVVKQIEQEVKEVLKGKGFSEVRVRSDVTAPVTAATQAAGDMKQRLPGVKHVIAVASGKGGVGKSTVATNLAVALQEQGLKVGLCDCDMYGPSIGTMYGTHERPMMEDENSIRPVEQYGLKLMSMSFLVEEDAPVILRGPMVTRYTQQFLQNVAWGGLDVLVLDLPPGTGDIQLTIVQTVALTGSVVVTTPQEVALVDARKAVKMFEKVNVPVLGLVENMSYFLCPSDGERYNIFGTGGGKAEAKKMKVPLLGEVPIDMATREAGDGGKPVVLEKPDGDVAKVFLKAAEMLKEELEKRG